MALRITDQFDNFFANVVSRDEVDFGEIAPDPQSCNGRRVPWGGQQTLTSWCSRKDTLQQLLECIIKKGFRDGSILALAVLELSVVSAATAT